MTEFAATSVLWISGCPPGNRAGSDSGGVLWRLPGWAA